MTRAVITLIARPDVAAVTDAIDNVEGSLPLHRRRQRYQRHKSYPNQATRCYAPFDHFVPHNVVAF